MLQTLVLKADLLAAEAIRHHLYTVFPGATCVLAQRIDEARGIMARTAINLLITGISLPDGDAIDFLLGESNAPGRHRPLVVTTRRAPRLLASLSSIPVGGAFDCDGDNPAHLSGALRAVVDGRTYWSPSFGRVLSTAPGRAILRQLSPTEQLVLAVIGNGATDTDAAAQLGLRPSSIQTVRRALHGKLGVHEKGDLIRAAAQLGFVQFANDGVRPLGLAVLRKEYLAQCKRPIAA